VDALPDFKTSYAGDDYCILPPPPELGFQIGIHPGGSKDYWEKLWAGDYSVYSNTQATSGSEVEAGGETLQNYDGVVAAGPTADQFFYRRNFRGRPGSHHSVVYFSPAAVTKEGWQDNGNLTLQGKEILLPQNPVTDIPESTLDPAPEEVGIGFPADSTGTYFNVHHFNTTDKAILRELWVNGWYIPKEHVTKEAYFFTGSAPVNYPPGMVLDNPGSVRATGKTQVLSIYGHRHAWTTRFHAWVVRSGSTTEELVYDSNDWYDVPTYAYNSSTTNPPPGNGRDGATSGPLILESGDSLHYNCHVETTRERAAEVGAPMPTSALRTANEAFTGEMCIVNGHTIGSKLGGFGF
jgi:hypothetical protein